MPTGARLLAALLLATPLLAGCIEGDGASPDLDGRVLAFYDGVDSVGGNRTLLVLREGGAADRLTYVADGSWLPRLAPGLSFPRADLDAVFEGTAAGRERGGLVLLVEHGRVPGDALAALAPLLDGEWPAAFAPPGEPHPWYRPVVMGRIQPRAVTEVPPDSWEDAPADHAPLHALREAFRRADLALEVESRQEADLPPFPGQDGWVGCLRAATSVVPEAARVGDAVEVRVEVRNCGRDDVLLHGAACREPPTAHVQVTGASLLARLASSEAPGPAYALDFACRGDAPDVRVPAGGSVVLVRRWNGSVAACASEDACEHRPAAPGEYHVFSFVSGIDEASPARLTLVPDDAPTTRLLVAREHDWVNTTASEPLMGSFGPHCAPVQYTTAPPSVSVWFYEERPAPAPGVIVRDWRVGERPSGVVTTSADRLDLVWLRGDAATLASPIAEADPLADVRLEGEDFVVAGERVRPGETLTLRREQSLEANGGTYHVTSILELENVGDAPVLFQRAGGCA